MRPEAATNKLPTPLKLVVIGASKGTGKAIVEEALARGHYVTAVARNPTALKLEHVKLTKTAADVTDPKTLEGIFDGAHAVLIALGSTLSGLKKDPTVFSRGTTYVLAAMRAAKVRRVVVLSANGTADSRNQFPYLLRLLILDGILKRAFVDHDRQEQVVRASTLAWTIARPGKLTDGAAKHKYVVALDAAKVPSSISRADVAHFMVGAAETDALSGKTAGLGG
jgi:putative NADH-flavin reductase